MKCPKCGKELNMICLYSYPAQYECHCNACDFKLEYQNRLDSYKIITQEELDIYYLLEIEESKL